jgi:exonuclease SbcC
VRMRFEKALDALQAADGRYQVTLEQNRGPLLQSLLRFEILAGVESPTELSRERLQMQVEVLRSTLKTGAVTSKEDALLDLCKLAALPDKTTVVRIEQLIGKLKSAG